MTEVGENTGFCIERGDVRYWVHPEVYRAYLEALKHASDLIGELETYKSDWSAMPLEI